MRILFVQDSLGTGGLEKSNAELWYFLREQNITIKVVVLEHRKEGVEKQIVKDGFDVVFLNPENFVKQSKSIAQIIKSFKPDIVHSALFRATMRVRFAKLFSKFFSLESLVSFPYDEVRFQDAQVNSTTLKFYRYLDKITQIKGVDRFVALTQGVKNHYVEHLGVPPNKIEVIHRGRKQNQFLKNKLAVRKEIRDEVNIKESDLVFVHVGRQEYAKSHHTLLKAIKIHDDFLFEKNAKFIFCGRKGNATPEIEQYLNSSEIKTPLKFLGHRSDIYKILMAADVFVFPSVYEGMGGALIEAQAAGLPIICSDIEVFHEVVKPDENALFFEKNNPKSLGERLVELTNNNVQRQEMGKKGLENFLTNFQIEKVHQQMLEMYKELI